MITSLEQILETYSSYIEDSKIQVDTKFSRIQDVSAAQTDDMVYALSEKYLVSALASKARHLCLHTSLKEKVVQIKDRNFIFSGLPELLVTRILQDHFMRRPQSYGEPGIHPTAIIADSAKIAENVKIGPRVIIEDHVEIAANSQIDANTIVKSGCKIGENTWIENNCTIANTMIGNNIWIQANSHLGTKDIFQVEDKPVVIGDNVDIGAGCSIQTGAQLMEGTKLDNRVFIGRNAVLEPHCLITATVSIGANAHIGHHFVTGGNTVVSPGVNICPAVQVGGLSFIDRDITEKGPYGGHPVQKLKDYLKTYSSIRKLPQIRKQLKDALSS